MTETTKRQIRVVIAKPGLDGHDVGAKLVCRALTDAGMDVTYSGLKRTPEEIAALAKEKEADVIGLSVLSGAHLPLCEKVLSSLAAAGIRDRLLLVGGVIPAGDEAKLKAMGFHGIFPVGTPFEEIVRFIDEGVRQ